MVEWGTEPPHGRPARHLGAHQEGVHMGILGTIIIVLVVGLIAGAVARLVVPGRQSMSVLATIVLGVVGSFVGGFLGFLLFHADPQGGFLQPAGIVGSIIGAIIALVVYLAVTGRSRAV